tara:strand:+ start:71 stop:298 length:228 start_codon:yes stop_codon:yes gene_type:complete
MVNREELVTKLEVFGTVLFCDENGEETYLIVMSDWIGTLTDFSGIVSVEVIPTYPKTITLTSVDGVIKSQFSKNI